METTLCLRDEDLLGKGAHKATYRHPSDIKKCVKIPYEIPDIDIKKELFYRKIIALRGKCPTILTKYWGTVKTNKGIGYCFDVVRDDDGQVSKSLKSCLSLVRPDAPFEINKIREILQQFKTEFLISNVITSDMDPENFLVQRIKDKTIIRIIDNIGTPVVIPAMYFIDTMARYHNKKYWKRFCKEQQKNFPHIFSEDFTRDLEKI